MSEGATGPGGQTPATALARAQCLHIEDDNLWQNDRQTPHHFSPLFSPPQHPRPTLPPISQLINSMAPQPPSQQSSTATTGSNLSNLNLSAPITSGVPTMFAGEREVAAADHAAQSATADECGQSSLPEIFPGFKADPLSTGISTKLENAFIAGRYISYPLLTLQGWTNSAKGQDDEVLMSINSRGELVSKPAPKQDDHCITLDDWHAAADLAVEYIRRFQSKNRTKALHTHHQLVTKLTQRYTWAAVVEYDIQQRELWAAHPTHDISLLDNKCLSLIVSERAQSSSQTKCPPPTDRDIYSSPPPPKHCAPLPSAQPLRLSLENHLYHLHPMEKPSLHQMGNNFVSLGLTHPHADTRIGVTSTMDVVSVVTRNMELGVAEPEPDPHIISTSINADHLECLLSQLGILDDWQHVLHGIHYGFDVGISDQPTQSFKPPNHFSCS
ncbi:hypothetical protein BDQ17DRAFT_1434304 [Cyathus striatus]|nr:hypothetical protein BDQ17DRAFT_1434304 [Cyathus striatus]